MVSSFSLSKSANQQLQSQSIENLSLPSHLKRGIGHSIELHDAMLGYSFCIHGEGWSAQANPPQNTLNPILPQGLKHFLIIQTQ